MDNENTFSKSKYIHLNIQKLSGRLCKNINTFINNFLPIFGEKTSA